MLRYDIKVVASKMMLAREFPNFSTAPLWSKCVRSFSALPQNVPRPQTSSHKKLINFLRLGFIFSNSLKLDCFHCCYNVNLEFSITVYIL